MDRVEIFSNWYRWFVKTAKRKPTEMECFLAGLSQKESDNASDTQ